MVALNMYREALEMKLKQTVSVKEPKQLYEPIEYILSLGGKRLRPVLTLLSCDFFDVDYKEALPAAVAVELFHNFSLVHDDIMDDAPLRRGNVTVHEKWDLNTGILSGDAILILAYQLFESYPAERFQELAKLFSETALKVCEGQQYDVDFESQNGLTIAEYLKMIDYKTAVLIGASMKMGAIVADASESCKENMYQFGRNLGIAFQIQDDYLDAFGNPETFGKQVGGDIIANKKTFLYLKALELSNDEDRDTLETLFNQFPEDTAPKVATVKSIFQRSGSAAETEQQIETYTQKAYSILDSINITEERKEQLRSLGNSLMVRKV